MKKIKINNKFLKVSLADTTSKHKAGLMFKKSLSKDEGMLFSYPEEKKLSFWMKNTSIPLSIAFIDSKGVINQIEDLEPYNEIPIKSNLPAKWALEVNKGWFKLNKVKEGDKILNLNSRNIKIKIGDCK
tara:strand:- start:28636 stop:29022 length:387 start_codon:yes stop_codon:yes gene_type:complete